MNSNLSRSTLVCKGKNSHTHKNEPTLLCIHFGYNDHVRSERGIVFSAASQIILVRAMNHLLLLEMGAVRSQYVACFIISSCQLLKTSVWTSKRRNNIGKVSWHQAKKWDSYQRWAQESNGSIWWLSLSLPNIRARLLLKDNLPRLHK